ncbi:MAG: UDP-N-acetylmuramoyl-L-alanyl-D-glutamate--2,6-diaminopimelate ligase [Nitrospirota bacterium]
MKLKEIIQGCDYIEIITHNAPTSNPDAINISGIAYDSRRVNEGNLFVAIRGEKYDGHSFIKEAIKKGAVAIIYERAVNNQMPSTISGTDSSLCFICVRDSRKALACVANNFYGNPSKSLTMVGVTGTNGKTTTTYFIKSIIESWGRRVGLIGTIQYMINKKIYPAIHTTPEAVEFQALLRDMLSAGCTHVVAEVSSHALAQYRVDETIFNTAVFTNLTRDHLDFHGTMENYFRAKERLFKELLGKEGMVIINIDDQYGKRLNSEIRTQKSPFKNILTYGIENNADIRASDINSSYQKLSFKISFRGRNYNISSDSIGLPNVYNIMSAVGVAISLGVPWEVICEGITKTGKIAGRFEKVDLGQGFLCIIDYAHTEDALERLIRTARELSIQHSAIKAMPSPRVITLFGCGGDRDRGKRPTMGAIATRLSDFVIITSDNPRFEEPTDIIKEIESGAVNKNYLIEPDRKGAIKKAIDMANDGDIILIVGKGHEDYQEIKGVRHKFSDKEVVKKVIKDKLKKNECRIQNP